VEDIMATISIIGSGNMGTAIAALATKGGYAVQQLGRGHGGRVDGEIVVLAVPYGGLTDVVSEYGDALVGKVVVDITNPVDFESMDDLVVDADSSAAAQLATALPGSKVVKAFNTNFAGTLASGNVGAVPTTVLVAGDDAEAKSSVAALVTSGGLRAVDAGTLKRASELEALGFLQITLAARDQIGWGGGFGVQS
jgi:predicted dinucleotide-binding enzyme